MLRNMLTFLALAHKLDATQLMGWGGLGWDVNVPCTCTHVGCYANQKFTRDLDESIRDYVFAFVCRTNWGNESTLKNLADLASKC